MNTKDVIQAASELNQSGIEVGRKIGRHGNLEIICVMTQRMSDRVTSLSDHVPSIDELNTTIGELSAAIDILFGFICEMADRMSDGGGDKPSVGTRISQILPSTGAHIRMARVTGHNDDGTIQVRALNGPLKGSEYPIGLDQVARADTDTTDTTI